MKTTHKDVKILMRAVFIGMGLLLMTVGSLSAAENLELRDTIEISGDVVMLGDLFDNAGEHAETPVFRAPAPGRSGAVSARRLIRAATANGLQWNNPDRVREVTITRRGVLIAIDDIEALLIDELANRLDVADTGTLVQIRFAGKAKPLYVPAEKMPEAEIAEIRFNRRSGRFSAVISAPAGDPLARRYTYSGRAVEAREIAVPTRTIRRGSVIGADDVELRAVPMRRIDSTTVEDQADLIGMAAKRTLRPDQPVRARDLERPKIVKKNGAVTVRYQAPGLMLTMRGRALEAGAMGDVITILNVQSKRKILGKIVGPNLVASVRETSHLIAATN